MLRGIAYLLRLIAQPRSVGYVGGTSFAPDARDLRRRLRSGEGLLDGPHTAEFEQALGLYYGGREAVAFGAGRMALWAILKAMDLAEGDEVILPGYTCVVAPNAIRFAGLRTRYVDVSLADFNMIPALVEKAITPRTRAILAQHTFGVACDMPALLDISRRHGIPIIEDCAHAIGARWDGRLLGEFGLAAFFSTEASKMLSTERGGFVVTGDRELAARIRAIQAAAPFRGEAVERATLARWCYRASYAGRPCVAPRADAATYVLARMNWPGVRAMLTYSDADYEDELAGRRTTPYPARLGNLMACAGLLQLGRLDEDVAHRRRLAAYLEAELPRLGAKVAEYPHDRAQPSWVRFPFVVEDRAAWMRAIARAGIVPGVWLDDPLHPRGSNWQANGYAAGMCPNAEYLSEHILNVPLHSRVTLAHLRRLVRCLERR